MLCRTNKVSNSGAGGCAWSPDHTLGGVDKPKSHPGANGSDVGPAKFNRDDSPWMYLALRTFAVSVVQVNFQVLAIHYKRRQFQQDVPPQLNEMGTSFG